MEADKTISIVASNNDAGKQVQQKQEPVVEQSCDCYQGIGSIKGEKPILKSNFSNGKSLVTCGYYDEDSQTLELVMSEFNIFDCDTGQSLVEYDAIQICNIREAKDSLIIEELKFMPAGKNWSWELFQIGEQIISVQNQSLVVSGSTPKFEAATIEEAQQNEFLNSIKLGQGIGGDWEEELGRLEVLSLMGNDKAWEILTNYEQLKGERTDGALAEEWKNAIANVNWIISQ